MKKNLFLFIALALTAISCSKDDNDKNDKNHSDLPKTIQRTDLKAPVENKTSTFIYDGNKIVSITHKFSRSEFTYEGNHITKKVDYSVTGDQPTKYAETLYSYVNGKLETVSYYYTSNTTSFSKYVYTYNDDGTIKKQLYSINTTTGVETKSPYSDLLTFANGNLTKLINVNGNGTSTKNYYYDLKNNPFKNIVGFSLLLDQGIISSLGQDVYSSVNNIEKYTESIVVTGNLTPVSKIYETKFEYNSNGFPTQKTTYNEDGTVKEIFDYTY
ncbi:hypothetical protein [Flavobacterium chungangensis]|uniref:DUF4595 domain-containing protein n=1 Tax=Flavobacterium chungangensis TaxID=2708132 RepID=A0ABV8ZFC3_9FLAO